MISRLVFVACCCLFLLGSCDKDPYKSLAGTGETVFLEDSICVTLQLIERSPEDLSDSDMAGATQLLSTQILLENYSGKEYFFFNNQFSLIDQDSVSYKPTLSSKNPPLGPSGKLVNGSTKLGWLTFELPPAREKLRLSFSTDIVDGDRCEIRLD